MVNKNLINFYFYFMAVNNINYCYLIVLQKKKIRKRFYRQFALLHWLLHLPSIFYSIRRTKSRFSLFNLSLTLFFPFHCYVLLV